VRIAGGVKRDHVYNIQLSRGKSKDYLKGLKVGNHGGVEWWVKTGVQGSSDGNSRL